jgi:Icc-related predicted phosphoesterase
VKIASFSDSHGCLNWQYTYGLPEIEEGTDIVCIAGDFVPIDIQNHITLSEIWFVETFFRWVKELKVDKVFLVAGNHDFYFQTVGKKTVNKLINEHDLTDKLIYLENDIYEYNGLKIIGSPWVKDLPFWAFNSTNLRKVFSFIEDCDILITHIPPMVDKVGCSNPYEPNERNFGSMELTKVLEDKNIKINICGHIHTGIHNGVQYGNTKIYNVSMIDEGYTECYPVTYFDI